MRDARTRGRFAPASSVLRGVDRVFGGAIGVWFDPPSPPMIGGIRIGVLGGAMLEGLGKGGIRIGVLGGAMLEERWLRHIGC
ncbi:UNVERIFIED_CONTAM: hypothetical protein BEN50_17655 [Euhalothece sp. KZN 001]